MVRLAQLSRTVAESDIVVGHDFRNREKQQLEIGITGGAKFVHRGGADAASPRSSVSSRRLYAAHNSGIAGGHGPAVRRDYRNRGKGIAGSRPSRRSLFGNAIVARVARLGAGAPLSLGELASPALPNAGDIPTSAFWESARPGLAIAATPSVRLGPDAWNHAIGTPRLLVALPLLLAQRGGRR